MLVRLAILAVTLAAAAGCSHSQHLMPTPVGFDDRGGDPFAHTPATMRTPPMPLFIAAPRKLAPGDPPAAEVFETVRTDNLQLGKVRIDFDTGDVPPAWPRLEQLSRMDDRPVRPTMAVAAWESYGRFWTGPAELDEDKDVDQVSRNAFSKAVNAELHASGQRNIYVFVHGFNTGFAHNCGVAAEMFHYLGRDGVMISYDWPSKDSLFSYNVDKTTASACVRGLRQLLVHLAHDTDVDRIHLIAHSAGAPIAIEALHDIRLMNYRDPADLVRRRYRLGRLALVAPDMDLRAFGEAVADRTTSLPERTLLYVSSRDKALDISAWIAGFARLGQPLDTLTPRQLEFLQDDANVELIDVVNAELKHGSWLGHSYFHEDPWVSSDVVACLRYGGGPVARGLRFDEARKVNVFPDDFPERARASCRAAVARHDEIVAAERATVRGTPPVTDGDRPPAK